MPTPYNVRTIPTTSYSWRDPVGRTYLATEDGKILTTEDGKWIILIDKTNTQYTWRPQILRWDTMSILETTFWDDLGTWEDSKYWNDNLSLGTPYTTRIIP